MDKLTKFILVFALVFLIVIIAIGRSYRPVSKKAEGITPAKPSAIHDGLEKKDKKIIKTSQEKIKKERKEELEVIKEETPEEVFIPSEERNPALPYFPDMEAYPETEFPSPSGLEEGLPAEMDPRQAYPPDYIPGEYGKYPEQGMPPEMYPQDYPPGEYSEEDILPDQDYPSDYPSEEPEPTEESPENQF